MTTLAWGDQDPRIRRAVQQVLDQLVLGKGLRRDKNGKIELAVSGRSPFYFEGDELQFRAADGLVVSPGSPTALRVEGIDSSKVKAGSAGGSSVDLSLKRISSAISDLDARVKSLSSSGEAFPVGSVFTSVVSTDPATLLGYGTWSSFGAGRVLVGLDEGDEDFDTAEETVGSKSASISAHAGTAVASHSSHTHDYTQVIQHTHTVNVTDPGHTHLTQRYPTATGSSSGFTIDTSMSGTPADNTLSTKSATTGISATTSNPGGSVATGTTDGPSATLSHSVTQPDAHDDVSVIQPSIVVYFWKRTA